MLPERTLDADVADTVWIASQAYVGEYTQSVCVLCIAFGITIPVYWTGLLPQGDVMAYPAG